MGEDNSDGDRDGDSDSDKTLTGQGSRTGHGADKARYSRTGQDRTST